MSKAVKRALRSLIQFIIGGGLTALTAAIAGDLSPQAAVYFTVVYGTVLSYLQNAAEDLGIVPKVLR